MAKWADYLITAVKFNSNHTHIDTVMLRAHNGSSFGSARERSRIDIISAIKYGVAFVTAFKTESGWQKGKKVIVVSVNGTEFIKTEPNTREIDNLDNLPEYE